MDKGSCEITPLFYTDWCTPFGCRVALKKLHQRLTLFTVIAKIFSGLDDASAECSVHGLFWYLKLHITL